MKKICAVLLVLWALSLISGCRDPDNSKAVIVVTITNTSTHIFDGDFITAAAPDASGAITFRLKAEVAGISINQESGQVSFTDAVTTGTEFIVIASAGGFDSDSVVFTAVEESIHFTTPAVIMSGTQIEVKYASGRPQTGITFSLRYPVDYVSVTPEGVLTFVYSRMFTFSGTSPAEGSRPQDGLRDTLTQGTSVIAQTFTVVAEDANGLTAEKTFTASREFFDDFRNGVNYDDWYIITRNWGGNADGGGNRASRADHVQFGSDGLLLFAGGDYHPEINRRRSGSAIATRFPLGAGRYEVRMKVHPRLGVCSAMWTFFWDNIDGNSIDNHEIDFEWPGRLNRNGIPAPQGHPTFESYLVTTWIRENVYRTTFLHHPHAANPAPANDGIWRTFVFEWRTHMVGSHVKGHSVTFYVDGVQVHHEVNDIPFISSNFWLGAWFPARRFQYNGITEAGWAGTPNFEMDVMKVDYFRFTPFEEDPWMKSTEQKYATSINVSRTAGRNEFPQAPLVSVNSLDWARNVGNWVSNPSFEHETPEVRPIPTGTNVPVVSVANAWSVNGGAAIVSNNARTGSRAMNIPSSGSASQMISAVYAGFVLDVSAWVRAAAANAAGIMRVEFLGFLDSQLTGTVNENIIATAGYTNISTRVTLPAGTRRIRLSFLTTSGTIYLDDVEIRMVR